MPTGPPLVAVAHGSRDPAAAESFAALLAAVRAARPGLPVHAAFLDHGQPRLADLLAGFTGTSVVVPLLLGAAYHSRVDVPAAIEGTPARQAAVLGPDVLLLSGLERRLADVGVTPGDPGTEVVLAAAGSTDEAAVEGVRQLAGEWRRAAGWRGVRAAFASAAGPTVDEAVRAARSSGAVRVAVASYLLFPGLFADTLAAAGADATSPPLGDSPEVVELVLRRYDAVAAPGPSGPGPRPRPGQGRSFAT